MSAERLSYNHLILFFLSWGFVGSPVTHFLMMNVPYDDCSTYAPRIPTASFAMFMMMFAAITPLLMTGKSQPPPLSASPLCFPSTTRLHHPITTFLTLIIQDPLQRG